MIKIKNLAFEYFERDEEGYLTEMINAIRGINFNVKKGDFVAIAGKNGSGKSTFAKILNRLLAPIEGTVIIGGLDAMDAENTIPIRKIVGMVFQNPDDQLVGSVVSEDIAFGAENIGVPQKELLPRVVEVSGLLGLEGKLGTRLNNLSGGERQKVAIAGVLAMKPECIVLDESTSMLDPKSRREILDIIFDLNKKHGITVIMISHLMDEIAYADVVYVMSKGKMVLKRRPVDIFTEREKLLEVGLDIPEIVDISNRLFDFRVLRKNGFLHVEQLADELKNEYSHRFYTDTNMQLVQSSVNKINPTSAIMVNGVSFSYGKDKFIDNLSIGVQKGEFVAVMGSTGAGKSTLLQLIAGLIKPKVGEIYVDGLNIWDKTTDIKFLRRKIGYVFQYPEHQLFAENVYEDVVFGPRNIGISEIEAEKRAYESIKLVGLSDDVYDMPISRLSGGQKRLVALAGVLAMKPEYLILDEPLAGLDPKGKAEFLNIINILHKEAGITILMVSHDASSVAKYADRIIYLEKGKALFAGETEKTFYNMFEHDNGTEQLPVIMQLLILLRKKGLPVDCLNADIEGGVTEIIRAIR